MSQMTISLVSQRLQEIVQGVTPNVKEKYIPHAVDSNVFTKFKDAELLANIKNIREQNGMKDKFVCFWNNRNAEESKVELCCFGGRIF